MSSLVDLIMIDSLYPKLQFNQSLSIMIIARHCKNPTNDCLGVARSRHEILTFLIIRLDLYFSKLCMHKTACACAGCSMHAQFESNICFDYSAFLITRSAIKGKEDTGMYRTLAS